MGNQAYFYLKNRVVKVEINNSFNRNLLKQNFSFI